MEDRDEPEEVEEPDELEEALDPALVEELELPPPEPLPRPRKYSCQIHPVPPFARTCTQPPLRCSTSTEDPDGTMRVTRWFMPAPARMFTATVVVTPVDRLELDDDPREGCELSDWLALLERFSLLDEPDPRELLELPDALFDEPEEDVWD